MRLRSVFVAIVLALGMVGLSVVHAQEGITGIGRVENLYERLEIRSDYATALSPDGSRIAYLKPEGIVAVCLGSAADFTSECVPLPETFTSVPNYLVWSPDGNHLAFTEDFAASLYEPDLWVLATNPFTAEGLRNLTDDQISGAYQSEKAWLDHTPRWSADSSALYFIRETTNAEGYQALTMGLYRIPLSGGEAERIHDLTGRMLLSIAERVASTLEGTLAFSPDGSQGALVTGARTVSVFGVTDTTQTPTDVFTTDDLATKNPFPAWAGDRFAISGIAWEADGAHLLIIVGISSTEVGGLHLPLRLEVATKTLTPLLNYADYSQDEMLAVKAEIGIPLAAAQAFDAIYLPKQGSLILHHAWTSPDYTVEVGQLGVLLPSEGTVPFPKLIGSGAFTERRRVFLPSASSDGKTIIVSNSLIGLE